MPQPSSPVLVVAAALVRPDKLPQPQRPHHLAAGTFLAAQRARPPQLCGQWELPGGKVEPDEAPIAALHREIREELGVRITLHAEVPPPRGTAWPLAGGRVMRVWLATTAGQPQRLSDEHQALAWVTPAQAFSLAWIPADLPIVQAICRAPWPAP